MVTLKTIAECCGVSAATVSKALNGAPDVKNETALRVRRIAAQLGYLPNAAARTLKTHRSLNFGIVLRDSSRVSLTHEIQAGLVNSFKNRAEELGYDVTFLGERLGSREMGFYEHARYRGCDGVLIMATDLSGGIGELVSSDMPAVVIDKEWDGCGCVCSDNAGGAAELVRYVCRRGHRRLAFIHGEDMAQTRRRLEGFRAACQELGLDIPEGYVQEAVYRDPVSTASAARRLMELPQPPECILFPDDMAYTGGLRVLEEMGLSVPRDISAVGYDGTFLSQALHPPLTTLRQDTGQMGACAAEELVRMAEGGKSYRPRRYLIAGTLVPGGTVSCKSAPQQGRETAGCP